MVGLPVHRHSDFVFSRQDQRPLRRERSLVDDPTDPEPDPQKKRKVCDPRVTHSLTLEVDQYGNVLKEVAVGYGRRQSDPSLPLQIDREKQARAYDIKTIINTRYKKGLK